MNNTIKSLVEAAGFIMWDEEEWGPGPGHIDWSGIYDKEFEQFLLLLFKHVEQSVLACRQVDHDGESLDTEYDLVWQLGFNAGLAVAIAEVNKSLLLK